MRFARATALELSRLEPWQGRRGPSRRPGGRGRRARLAWRAALRSGKIRAEQQED